MNDTLLTLFGFALGILTTVVAQAIIRRWQLADAKQRLKLGNFRRVKEWMSAFQVVLSCDFPEMSELLMANYYLEESKLQTDSTAPERVYQELKKYQRAWEEFEKTEKAANEAIESLGGKRYRLLDTLTRLRFLIFSRHTFMQQSAFIRDYEPGFPRDIAPYLKELSELKNEIYRRFPEKYVKVDWKKLDFIKPAEVRGIISLPYIARWKYEEKDESISDARNRMFGYKGQAERIIEQLLRVVRKHEKSLIVP
jgi:hypothetical protein